MNNTSENLHLTKTFTVSAECSGYEIMFVLDGWKKYNIIAILVLNLLLAPLTAILNLFVVIAICKYQRLQSSSNILLANLGTTDMLTGFITQPILSTAYIFAIQGQVSCKTFLVAGHFGYWFSTMSYVTFVCIWSERYFAVFYPYFYIRYNNKGLLVKFLVALWVLFFLAYTAQLLIPSQGNSKKHVIVVGFISVTCGWGFYVQIKIVLVVRKIRRQVTIQRRDRNIRNTVQRCTSKATKVSVSVLLAMLICYLPYCIVSMSIYTLKPETSELILLLHEWSILLVLSNSICNVLIYCYRLKDFREPIYGILLRLLRVRTAE